MDDNKFTCSMTVTYLRNNKQTIVQETLKGSVDNTHIQVIGVNFTYIEQGRSHSYSLDSFELEIAEDQNVLKGKAILKHGNRDVVFKKYLSK